MDDAAFTFRSCIGYKYCMWCKEYNDMINGTGGGSKFNDPRFYEAKDRNCVRALKAVEYLRKNTDDDKMRARYVDAIKKCKDCDSTETPIADLLAEGINGAEPADTP